MKITIDINTAGAAFTDEFEDTAEANKLARHEEVGRILKDVSVAIFAGAEGGRCVDYNGNTVGLWSIENDRPLSEVVERDGIVIGARSTEYDR